MFKQFIYSFFFCMPLFAGAQGRADTLLENFNRAITELDRYKSIRDLYNYYEESNRDSALRYARLGEEITRRNKKQLPEIVCITNQGYHLGNKGEYPESFRLLTTAFRMAQDPKTEDSTDWPVFTYPGKTRKDIVLAYVHHMYAILMFQTGNTDQEIFHFRTAREIAIKYGHKPRILLADMNLGRSYNYLGMLDSALLFEKEAERLAIEINFTKYLGTIYSFIGRSYYLKGDERLAVEYYHKGVAVALQQENLSSLAYTLYLGLANYYIDKRTADSAIYYSMLDLKTFESLGITTSGQVNLGTMYENLYRSYELNQNHDSVYKYQRLALRVKDSIYQLRIQNLARFQNLSFDEQLKLQRMEKEKEAYRNSVRTWVLLGAIGVFLLLASLFFYNSRQKQKANRRLEKAYAELKATQTQLIHSEKMASLGELTAGIAHEIQNPLNFVNNFSDLNNELLEEMLAELKNGKVSESIAIADDIRQNNEKIVYHGKRADSIVKSMLQHSRNSNGLKEPTDINELVDECLRLSFHGMRAKDKSFNVKLETNLAPNLPKASIVSQDIGRVLLNLFTNAFYSVSQRKRSEGPGYEPVVEISTKSHLKSIEIRVKDNGTGIPQKVIDKVFQPFFTTKPTGEGTGLGLSMSFDIITKGHGGELKVESVTGEYAIFRIILPV